jgi:pyruvate/2-oxoglutarate dehydrogenase complex dihydrolipoamide dehydrogenase (E3) component
LPNPNAHGHDLRREDVDAVVVGMGPGGEHVANKLAAAGLDVVGVDRELLGGVCPYWGCVPSKMMLRAALALAEASRVEELAGRVDVASDWAPVARRIRDEATNDWNDAEAVERFESKGGRFVRGTARLTGSDSVVVGDREFHTRRALVLATGTTPAVPPIEGLSDTPFWTNRDAVATESRPESLIVVGAGAIGSELAQVFARFGTDVALVELADRVLPGDEPEASAVLDVAFQRDAITVHTGVGIESVRYRSSMKGGTKRAFEVRLEGSDTPLTAERLLIATGRSVDLASLGVGALGLDESADSIDVDDCMRVCDGVWAVGDVTGNGNFTHVANYQAGIAGASILGDDHRSAEYHAVPRVTFTDPEVGAVGLTEHQANERGLRVATGLARLPETSRGFVHGPGNDGVVKLVADAAAGHLVGATAVGPTGGEVLGHLALAVHARIPIATLESMIYAYPTFHGAILDALSDLDV